MTSVYNARHGYILASIPCLRYRSACDGWLDDLQKLMTTVLFLTVLFIVYRCLGTLAKALDQIADDLEGR